MLLSLASFLWATHYGFFECLQTLRVERHIHQVPQGRWETGIGRCCLYMTEKGQVVELNLLFPWYALGILYRNIWPSFFQYLCGRGWNLWISNFSAQRPCQLLEKYGLNFCIACLEVRDRLQAVLFSTFYKLLKFSNYWGEWRAQ